MTQIADAPWIRDAEANGYPVGEDEDTELNIGDCPAMPSWLWGE